MHCYYFGPPLILARAAAPTIMLMASNSGRFHQNYGWGSARQTLNGCTCVHLLAIYDLVPGYSMTDDSTVVLNHRDKATCMSSRETGRTSCSSMFTGLLSASVNKYVLGTYVLWMCVLIEILSRVEGPLSDSVRVVASIRRAHLILHFESVMYVPIHESGSFAVASNTDCNCLTSFRPQMEAEIKKSNAQKSDHDGGESSTVFTMAVYPETSKASMLFTFKKSRASPGSISVTALSRTAICAPDSCSAD